MLDLESIKARLSAITPLPWMLLPKTCGPDDNHPQANMEFIRHAPEDIKALLAEIKALNNQLRIARET